MLGRSLAKLLSSAPAFPGDRSRGSEESSDHGHGLISQSSRRESPHDVASQGFRRQPSLITSAASVLSVDEADAKAGSGRKRMLTDPAAKAAKWVKKLDLQLVMTSPWQTQKRKWISVQWYRL